MGANAQTAVPTFTSGQVLTAQQQNDSARTGVPVFASSTTRNAAFGGSNKTLAQGQLAYLENVNYLQVYNGNAWVNLNGDGAQILTAQTTTSTTYTDLATVGPTVTTDTGTTALVFFVANAYNTLGSGNTARISFSVSGASTIAASDTYLAATTFWSANAYVCMSSVAKITGLTSGSNTFTMKYKVDGSTIAFADRKLIVIPLP